VKETIMDDPLIWLVLALVAPLWVSLFWLRWLALRNRQRWWNISGRLLELTDRVVNAEESARKCSDAAQRARTLMQQAQVVSAASPAKTKPRPGW
jgi:hypothetical protein